MKRYQLSALVLDFSLYPRGSIDSHHASEIVAALQAGTTMPPIVIDMKSKRVIDGFHRIKAYQRLFDEHYKVECVEKNYKSEAMMFLDAMRCNSTHGRALTQFDKVHCLLLANKFHLADSDVAGALHITSERIGELRSCRIGSLRPQSMGTFRPSGAVVPPTPIALKNTIAHMTGKELTPEQSAVNDKLSGMNASFYVNQIAMLIENDLINVNDADILEGLSKLQRLLQAFLKRRAA
jgi:hypothetical protein